MSALAVFALDWAVSSSTLVAVLYMPVLVLAAQVGRERDILTATLGCIALTILARCIAEVGQPLIGSLFSLSFVAFAIGLTGALLLGRSRLQRALAESRAELVTFTDAVPYLLWRGTPEGNVDFLNQRYTELTGHDRDAALAEKTWRMGIHEDDLPEYWARRSEALANGTEFRAVFRLRHMDGEYRWKALIGQPIRSRETGEITRWYGGISDAHEEVLAQQRVDELMSSLERRVNERSEALAVSQERFAKLWEVSNITFAEQDFTGPVAILDRLKAEGVTDLAAYFSAHPKVLRECIAAVRTVSVNPAAARMMGFESMSEMLARPVAQTAEEIEAIMLKQLELPFYGRHSTEGRAVLIGKDGLRVPIFYTVQRLPDEMQLSSHLDLTQQQQAEEMRLVAQDELARANRVATLGAFSISVAHELNQPIASLMIDAKMALRDVEKAPPALDNMPRVLARVSRTAERIAGIVGSIRESINGRERALRRVNVCALAHETAELLRRDVQHAAAILELACGADVPAVSADAVELQQVLVNLILNAAEAMSDWEGERRIRLSIASVSGGVHIAVSDTGRGIKADLVEKVFDPFFTTKEEGIGMGLLICKNAVSKFGGELQARNRPEGGAEFHFVLPAAEAPPEDAARIVGDHMRIH